MSEAFIGEIKAVGFNFAPRNYSIANGATIAISQNSALFALLGTYYGGNGQTTFQLPNLQSRVAIGYGQGQGLSNYVIGQTAGSETTTLTLANLPAHNHTAAYTPPSLSSLTAQTTINALTQPPARQTSPAGGFLTGAQDGGGAPVSCYATTGTAATLASGAATTIVGGSLSGGSVTIGVTGSNYPFNTLQPYLAINYVIALYGIFPSRN